MPANGNVFTLSRVARRYGIERLLLTGPDRSLYCVCPGGPLLCTQYSDQLQKLDPRSLRKEVIQPQVLLRLPCYDFTPIMSHTLGRCLLTVSLRTSSATHFRDVTGGVYKARERIHGVILIRHY